MITAFRLAARLVLALLGLLPALSANAQVVAANPPADASSTPAEFDARQYEFRAELPLPAELPGPYVDFLATPELFDRARLDLADVRILDARGVERPYAVRVRATYESRERVAAREYNEGTVDDEAAQRWLDLGADSFEHNELAIHTVGLDFRRRAVVEGSPDEKTWTTLAETNLLRFANFDQPRITYPTSRFRYLRLTVHKDPTTDTNPPRWRETIVHRTRRHEGFYVTREAKLGPREPARRGEAVGSQWLIDLGGENLPCKTLEFDVAEPDFFRSARLETVPALPEPYRTRNDPSGPYRTPVYTVEAEAEVTRPESFDYFSVAHETWQRRAGEPRRPMKFDFGHRRVGQLRLFVADHANRPLTITQVRWIAPEVQFILAADDLAGPLQVFWGNPLASSPQYDFASNLRLPDDAAPARATLGPRTANPDYVPPPLPFTERWRWLIHTALAVTCAVLGLLILQLARAIVARHDAEAAEPAEAAAS